MCRVECELIEGEITIGEDLYQHYWLELTDGRIIDPTASQFNGKGYNTLPDVYLGAKPDHYKMV